MSSVRHDQTDSDSEFFEGENFERPAVSGFGLFSDTSDSDAHDENLVDSIAEWAVKFNISHSALKILLQLLRKWHPGLPKDPRTLLKTCTTVASQNVAGGSYYHFGLPLVLQTF
jgi:hypothetical protein